MFRKHYYLTYIIDCMPHVVYPYLFQKWHKKVDLFWKKICVVKYKVIRQIISVVKLYFILFLTGFITANFLFFFFFIIFFFKPSWSSWNYFNLRHYDLKIKWKKFLLSWPLYCTEKKEIRDLCQNRRILKCIMNLKDHHNSVKNTMSTCM